LVSEIAPEKLPPLAVALEVPPLDTSASEELPESDAFAFACPDPSELAKQSLPSVPERETLVLCFSTHPTVNGGGLLASAGTTANAKTAATANPMIKLPDFIAFPSREIQTARYAFEWRDYSSNARHYAKPPQA